MQPLSIWPSNFQFCVAPQLEFELGSSCVFNSNRWRRKKDLGLRSPSCNSRGNKNLELSRSSVSSGIGIFWECPSYLKCGHFSVCYQPNFIRLCETKKVSSGALVSLRWALEEQEVDNECFKEGANYINALSENNEKKDIGELKEGIKSCAENEDRNKVVEDTRHREDVEEGKEERVDVRALAEGLKLAKTADDVEEILKDKRVLPLQVYSTMIRAFGREKNMDSAVALVKWLKRQKEETNGLIAPNIFIYNSLLGAMKQSEKYEEVEEVLGEMANEGITPNLVTYNTLMVKYLEQGQPAEALNLFNEIQRKGLSLSPVSYSTVLLAYRRMEDGNGALSFFVKCREKYWRGEIEKVDDEDWESEFVKLENFTSRICYQVMRRWLVSDENSSTNVLKLLIEMDNAGLTPSQGEHERLVWACNREEHYIVARELYKRIREKHSDISLSVCNHVIWLLGKAKKWWAALEIYEDLLDKGPQPNNMSYELIMSHFSILLTAARKRGIWRWGIRLLNKMEEKGFKPESRQWNAVLIACSKASETSSAVETFRRMIEKGEKPTIISYSALLSALEKGKLYEEAWRVWEHMIKVGVKPNLYAYTIMASVFSQQGKFHMVDAIMREMDSSGVHPTVVTYNAIISACACNSSAAYEWFHRMKVQNIEPNEITYEMLIEALARDGKPRLAYELYLRAQNGGLNLSSKAYNAVLQSSQVYGASIDTSVLVPPSLNTEKNMRLT